MDAHKDFELLINSCKNSIERFIFYKIPIREDALDVIQETYMAAYKNWCLLRNETKFKPWLLSIAKNKCNDYFRRVINVFEIPLDETLGYTEYMAIKGRDIQETVNETLLNLSNKDREILFLFYIKGLCQRDISTRLDIPIGTVKSRLNTARHSFKDKYPYPPKMKGENHMSNTKFPVVIPKISIIKIDKPIFSVLFQELPGWFIIPVPGEKISWAFYDYPGGAFTAVENCEVIGKAQIHGVNCVEIKTKERFLYARLTDTHVQYIADIYFNNGIKVLTTFLDDNWSETWSYGEDNCGRETHLIPGSKGVEGLFVVNIGNKTYETIRFADKYTDGIYTETYIDRSGRTVLWRRYNRYDWAIEKYKSTWIEKLPDNERISIDNDIFVHWYDCISDYVL